MYPRYIIENSIVTSHMLHLCVLYKEHYYFNFTQVYYSIKCIFQCLCVFMLHVNFSLAITHWKYFINAFINITSRSNLRANFCKNQDPLFITCYYLSHNGVKGLSKIQ